MKHFRYPLNLQFFEGEKTERATPHKRQESRKQGEVFKSADLGTAISLFAFFLYFRFAGGSLGEGLASMMSHVFQNSLNMDVTENNVHQFFSALSIQSLFLLIPILIVALVAGIAGQLFQVGFLFQPGLLAFKPDRISLLKGLKRVYSMKAIMELLKSLLKILLIGLVAFSVIWINRDPVVETGEKSLGDGLVTMAKIVLDMGLAASATLIVLAVFDYYYQKFEYEKNMRMSKQDVKDEYKNMEGDPKIKSRIRERQKQMAMRRMMQELPKADVVITNPTHFAVALQYDAVRMSAPRVIAKGADQVAFRIKAIAREHEIVIVEKKPLARALYFQLDVGDSVPEEFFKAVAEILAYVYRLNGKA